MQLKRIGIIFLALFLMPFLSLPAVSEEPVVDTVSSVVIDTVKKMVDPSKTIPFHYTETIRNISSDKPAFVNIDVYELNNIGEKQEGLTPVKISDDAAIYAMPNQIIVPAGGVRTVRVYLTEKLQRDDDRYYRIRFSPSALLGEEGDESKEKQVSRSSLHLGMGAGQLLMVSRKNPSFNTKVSINKDAGGKNELVIHNMGNSYIRLENMKTCFIKTAKKPCQYISGRHINAGHIKKLLIDTNVSTVHLELIEGEKVREVIYDRQSATPLKLS